MLGSGATPGVMVLTVEELFRRIHERENEMSCEIAVSYIEVHLHCHQAVVCLTKAVQVYNEQVRDLFNPQGYLAVRDDSNQGLFGLVDART